MPVELLTALQALICFCCVFLFISTGVVVMVGYYKSKFYDLKYSFLRKKLKDEEDIKKVVIINDSKRQE